MAIIDVVTEFGYKMGFSEGEKAGRKKAIDSVYVEYLNRDNDDSFIEWLQNQLED